MADEDNTFIGTSAADTISDTDQDDMIEAGGGDDDVTATDGYDRVHGQTGEDNITGGEDADLIAGGGAGAEWTLVNGKWTYNPGDIAVPVAGDPYAKFDGSDDVLYGNTGDDVLLGNAGNDTLHGGAGDDVANGGSGQDSVFGGQGDDLINLESGDDYAEGGAGADIVNAGDGNDTVYGDTVAESILSSNAEDATSMAQHAEGGDWSFDAETGSLSQAVTAENGHYSVTFDLAANIAGGSTSGAVEVLWNGEVVETVDTSSGVFTTHTIDLQGVSGEGELTLRVVEPEGSDGPEIITDAPIAHYMTEMDIGGETVEVAAFAPGQAKLYQMIDGTLNVFDTQTKSYEPAGDSTGLKINAIGFNAEDDLIYGIAKRAGVDALGNPVSAKDLVMVDAEGNAYRVGETPVGDYVGDFDDKGNLFTFDSSVNRITKIDVDNLDADGNPVVENYYLPKDFLQGRTYDIAFNAEENAFYAVEAPGQNGGTGTVHKIDMSNYDGTGTPEITSIPINSTLVDGEMVSGMAKGAYGAVFLDGDGNLYAGLNRGDHDLDGSTAADGGIYKINIDFDGGAAYAELMSEAPPTGSNDGAVDPRAADAFSEVDASAEVLIRDIQMTPIEGGNDDLRGGAGEDSMWGGAGDDTVSGGADNDMLHGDAGADKLQGGDGDDQLWGGTGNDTLIAGSGEDHLDGGSGNDLLLGGSGTDNESFVGGSGDDRVFGKGGDDRIDGGDGADKLYGESGNDTISGGDGADTVKGGSGDDTLDGGDANDMVLGGVGNDTIQGGGGVDKLVGGSGSDVIEGGAGNDHIWGGNWWKDNASDTFVYSKGGGKDMIHDFEAGIDQIDLSSYGLEYADIEERISDLGYATEIDLTGIAGSGANDKILLKSVKADDLDESSFII